MDGEGFPMVIRRAIIAALLLSASHALAWGPDAIDDMMAGLIATSGGGTVVEQALRSPKIAGIWDAATGKALDGTNILTWTDSAFGNVATATSAAMRAYFDATNFNGFGAVVFGGSQAYNLATSLEMSNSTTIVIGWRSSGSDIFFPLGRSDVDVPATSPALWNNNTAYYHAGANSTGTISTGISTWTNCVCLSGSNSGGPASTNTYQIRRGSTNIASSTYVQAPAGSTVNRIGGRKTERMKGSISLILHFHPALTAAELAEFESLAIEERMPK